METVKKGKGIASLVLGIASIIISPLGLILGIVAIVMSNLSKKENDGNAPGVAKGGLICGIAGIVFGLIAAVITVIFLGIAAGVIGSGVSKYTDKSNASGDAQVCDSVKTAVVTTCLDPEMVYQGIQLPSRYNGSLEDFLDDMGPVFEDEVLEILGVRSASELNKQLKGKGHSKDNSKVGLWITVESPSRVIVYIPDSCMMGEGKKCDNPYCQEISTY